MGDRCCSTLVCAAQNKTTFEKMGYSKQEGPALTVDGNDIPNAVVMFAEEAGNGNYDALTALKGIPFIVCNGSCRGAFGDHLIVSDGKEWHYSEALHESNYPSVRVEPDGVRYSEVDDARKYWRVHASTVVAIKNAKSSTVK